MKIAPRTNIPNIQLHSARIQRAILCATPPATVRTLIIKSPGAKRKT